MLVLSDSTLCADARHRRAITDRPEPCGKNRQLAALSAHFLLVFLIMFTLLNARLHVAVIAVFMRTRQARPNMPMLPNSQSEQSKVLVQTLG